MLERKMATKAIILARVSSKEQEDNYSIDAQTYRLQEYCLRRGLELLKTFQFCEFSTVGNREKFLEAIEFAKKQKEIIAVVVYKVDRLQRGYKEMPLLNELVKKEKIELHFYTENCVIHKGINFPRQDGLEYVCYDGSKLCVDSLRDNINSSIAQKLRSGKWVSIAPIGYLHVPNNKDERGKGSIIIDPVRAPLVKKIFETYATGNHTAPEILEKPKSGA